MDKDADLRQLFGQLKAEVARGVQVHARAEAALQGRVGREREPRLLRMIRGQTLRLSCLSYTADSSGQTHG